MQVLKYVVGSAAVMLTSLVLGCGGGGGGGSSSEAGAQGTFAGCNSEPQPNPGVIDPQSAQFNVVGTQAFMNGVIDGQTPARVQNLIINNPGVTEIVLQQCPGSADDDSNIAAARLVRAAGLNTRTEPSSFIASGAVDFFLAGVQRTADPASQVHVHTWVGGDGTLGRDLARNDCQHALFVAYYQQMGLADPEGFYFYTLQFGQAPDGLPTHNMTAQERAQYGISTP